MDMVQELLKASGISYKPYHCNTARTIWITGANQLVSTYDVLTNFVSRDTNYRGWHAHHVVEFQDLQRLGVAAGFPVYGQQLTVLLPQKAHIDRINSVLRNQAPMYANLQVRDLLSAYEMAYSMIGDYSGGGEHRIKAELMAIVRATLRRAKLAA